MFTKSVPVLLAAMLSVFGAISCPNVYGATSSLTAVETKDLIFMREEEKVARDTYLTFYDVWDLATFSNIASAEQSHMDALLKLLNKYNLPDPAAGNAIGEFTNTDLQSLYNTLVAKGEISNLNALNVGGLIEEKDMVDIKRAISEAQKDDIISTYTNLMCGSRNHLRGFAKSIEALTGAPYVAQILSQAEVNEIVQSPIEKCGKKEKVSSSGNACKGKC